MSIAPDTKQAEKDYLARMGSSAWERAKPFSPPGTDTFDDSTKMLHDFAVAMLTLQPSPDDLVLDLGAGACWCSDLLGRLNRTSVAVDISVDMLAAGRTRPGTSIRAVAGDMESLPFRTGSFQKAVCLSAIHHVPKIPAALREIARVLDDRGVALFSEPGLGHADAPVSTAAMRDFGVLEQDILIHDFVRACDDAGFTDVRVKPLAYTVPGFDLTLEEWDAWTRVASSKRPRRALQKMALACAEFLGLGKRGPLYEDTLGISLVRTLRPIVEHHPIIVASKSAVAADTGPRWQADVQVVAPHSATAGSLLEATVTVANTGAAVWRPTSQSGIGHVTCGVQLLDASHRLITRDHFRASLPRTVAPGEHVTLTMNCPMPMAPGSYALKFDLVAEGVTWFETAGSTTASLDVTVR